MANVAKGITQFKGADQLKQLFHQFADKNGFLSSQNMFLICKTLNVTSELVPMEIFRKIITKEHTFWQKENKRKSTKLPINLKTQHFNMKDYMKAFEIMATPVEQNMTSTEIIQHKMKFFQKLSSNLERLNTRSAAKTVPKSSAVNTSAEVMSGKSTPEMFGSTGAAIRGKKMINNSVLNQKRPLLKKKLNQKFTDANTIKNVYVPNLGLKRGLVGIDKKAAKMKMNKKLRKRTSTKANKRREYKMIDLTLNHHDDNSIDTNSEFNFTTTEGSLPPLDRTSELGSD